jgi:hypothetical protein
VVLEERQASGVLGITLHRAGHREAGAHERDPRPQLGW